MPSPITPNALKPGDTISFVSPSLRLNDVMPDVMARATALLTSRGYKVKAFFKGDEDGTGSAAVHRLSELREAFSDLETSAIICTIGGSTFTELLPALIADTELHAVIRANPKIVIGYSDITGLHWFLYALTGLRTFYGPGAIPELGEASALDDEASPAAFCARELLRTVSSSQPIGKISRSLEYAAEGAPFWKNHSSTKRQKLEPTRPWRWIRGGKSQGRLFGGCLTVMVRLMGVRELTPDWKGRIAFIESAAGDNDDIGPLPLRVRAAFADLRAHGAFNGIKGLVVGRPYGYDTEERIQLYADIVKEIVGTVGDFPILMDVDFGHTTPMVTLPYDVEAVLDSEKDLFEVIEGAVQ